MPADPHNHPPASVKSLWRLRGYLKPHIPTLLIMLTTSMAGVGVAIAIPLVIKALIDGPIDDHRARGILPLGLLVLGLGVLEAFLIWWRRWVQNKAVLAVETQMRRDLYDRLQELPMSFHSQWQSGQLLSRATTDLSAIRRFFGFGMLFLLVNITQVVVTTLVLLHMYWPLGLVVAATSAPIVWLSMRFEKAYVVVSRRVQDQQGDLATLAEEGAVGIRVIKSFGRTAHVSDQYDAAARTLLETSVDKVRLSAKFWTFLEMIPNLAVVAVLLLGSIGVGRGALTPGELVAFITLAYRVEAGHRRLNGTEAGRPDHAARDRCDWETVVLLVGIVSFMAATAGSWATRCRGSGSTAGGSPSPAGRSTGATSRRRGASGRRPR